MTRKYTFLISVVGLATVLFAETPAQARFGEGLTSAAQSYGLGQLVAAAKRTDPDSPIPSLIEHLLTGIAMAKNPQDVLVGVYPGSLAASAIEQLIKRHGPDIARMTYRERKVFIGGPYSDPSIIPENREPAPLSKGAQLCEALIEKSEFRYCTTLVGRIPKCSAVKNLSRREISNCNKDLTHFYELMEYEGLTRLAREAGKVAGREMRTIPSHNTQSARLLPGTEHSVRSGYVACPRTRYELIKEEHGKPTNLAFLEKKSNYSAGKITNGSDGSIPTKIAECKYRGPNSRISTVIVTWHARAGHFDKKDPALCYKGWNELGPWLTEYRYAHPDRSIYVQIARLIEGNNRASDLFTTNERETIARHLMQEAEPSSFPCVRPWEN